MNSAMTYEKLYNNMVKKFTVEKDNTDYTLGDYMLMKAKAKKTAMTTTTTTALTTHEHKTSTLATVLSYINDKLTVKEAPVRDKTMRSFPLRTSFTALSSALVVCALVVSCCFFGASASMNGTDNTVTTTEETEKNETEEITKEETALVSFETETF